VTVEATTKSPQIGFTPINADQLAADIARMPARDAANVIEGLSDKLAMDVLQRVNPAIVAQVMDHLDVMRREQLFATGPTQVIQQWNLNHTFELNTVGRLMEPPTAVFRPDDVVSEVTSRVKELVKKIFVTYCFVTDADGKFVGIVTMRDLLVSDGNAKLADIMLKNPFFLKPQTDLMDAMKQVLNRHFPLYPVCDDSMRLIGLVRGQAMFEAQAVEISAQAGTMVGIKKEERLVTPWPTSLKFRHPWLQLNLLTAFVAAAVVGFFQDTVDKLVILALFLPVLAGQSGNTGCQALAVTLRGMTLGELKKGTEKELVVKEALLGVLNGTFVGLSAGIGMFVVARMQHNENALALSMIVMLAMIGSCMISGISGALIPMALKRVGADPATASSIFLTTATDVASMGMLLGLATMFLM
jgi:magnesium transporter